MQHYARKKRVDKSVELGGLLVPQVLRNEELHSGKEIVIHSSASGSITKNADSKMKFLLKCLGGETAISGKLALFFEDEILLRDNVKCSSVVDTHEVQSFARLTSSDCVSGPFSEVQQGARSRLLHEFHINSCISGMSSLYVVKRMSEEEVHILLHLQHPSIVKLRGVCLPRILHTQHEEIETKENSLEAHQDGFLLIFDAIIH